jgi:hypothetical protein
MESRKRPIDELLEEVRCMRSNLERMNRDIGYIKKIIKEKEEKEDKDKYAILDNNRENTPAQRGWFGY